MLRDIIDQFLDYCRLANFSQKSIQAFEIRLRELRFFLDDVEDIRTVDYLQLVEFTANYRNPSIHVVKSRVWTIRQFFHFLALKGIAENIAGGLAYPKIDKTIPQFLTREQYDRLLDDFCTRARDLQGMRNLSAFLLLSVFGVRTGSLLSINCDDVDIECGLIWIREKGRQKRGLILPAVLCRILETYLSQRSPLKGPLLITRRNKRLSARTLQQILQEAGQRVGIDIAITPRLFRHSAATHINRVADIEITQHVLGHRRRANTVKYTHLNPDVYVDYMLRHPYMTDA